MNDFLFEIGTEELPTAAVKTLSEALAEKFRLAMRAAQIAHGEIKFFGTPRRLAILVRQMATVKPSEQKIRKGPMVNGSRDAEGMPTPALQGFAKSCGVAIDDLQTQMTEKGEWWIFESHTPEQPMAEILPEIMQTIVTELPIKKPMRWGAGEVYFCRPVHWGVLLWGKEVLKIEVLGVTTGQTTYGHRFHHPEEIKIADIDDYEDQLLQAKVIADFQKRQDLIAKQIKNLAQAKGFTPIIPPALLEEVTSIVEWPQALMADFDPNFLNVPPEVLIAAMQNHQKCFPLQDNYGELAPHFIAISNIESKNLKQVKAGNEKVMQARLSDAAFFFQKDKAQGLSAHIPGLKQVVFQTQLGSLADKTTRMAAIMEIFSEPFELSKSDLSRAAALSKCDLLTGMVGEFPELEGIMGYYYALEEQESPNVALALKEQYLPRFAKDDLPTSALGLALSLADRLDTLVGLFAIGQKPTGDKDPFKLRRHALAVVRMLIHTASPIRLTTCLQAAVTAYASQLQTLPVDLLHHVQQFILERLQAFYQSQAVSVELLSAVRANQEDCLYDLDQRIQALKGFIASPQAQALANMAKRVVNVLAQAKITHQAVDASRFKEEAEHALWHVIEEIETQFANPLSYSDRLQSLANLQQPLNTFFAEVLVMDKDQDLQNNRLALLRRLQNLLNSVAELSHLG